MDPRPRKGRALVPDRMRCYSPRMRRVGELPTERDAKTFQALLLTQGIESSAEPEDTGSVSIWVHDDDQISEAGKMLGRYRQAPDAPEFRTATDKAAKLQAEAAKAERQRRSTVIDEARLGYERNFLGQGWVAILFIVLSVAVTYYTDFFANLKAMQHVWISIPYGLGGSPEFLPEVRDGQVWRLITPIFAHGSLMHIVFNMMWLYQLGRFIETRFGPWKLLALILVIGVGSNFAQYLWNGPRFGGMSGVNYGLFGFLWIKGKFGRAQNWQLDPQTVQLMLVWMVLCYTGLLGPVANAAHTVGLIIGVILGFASARLVPWLENGAGR